MSSEPKKRGSGRPRKRTDSADRADMSSLGFGGPTIQADGVERLADQGSGEAVWTVVDNQLSGGHVFDKQRDDDPVFDSQRSGGHVFDSHVVDNSNVSFLNVDKAYNDLNLKDNAGSGYSNALLFQDSQDHGLKLDGLNVVDLNNVNTVKVMDESSSVFDNHSQSNLKITFSKKGVKVDDIVVLYDLKIRYLI